MPLVLGSNPRGAAHNLITPYSPADKIPAYEAVDAGANPARETPTKSCASDRPHESVYVGTTGQ